MAKLSIACLQTNSQADIDENIQAAARLVAQAVTRGAQLIALPENAFHMRAEGQAPPVRYAQEEHPGVLAARAWAREHGVWILAGSVAVSPEEKEETRPFNRSLLIDDTGRIAAAYDKLHLFDVEVGDGQDYCESARIRPGDKAVLAPTPWGGLGMSVCYDLRFPQLYRALAQAGASMLAVPSAFTAVTGAPHWHVLLRARAIENACFVIAPAQTGQHPGGRRTFGHSLIIDPWGRVLADGGTEPGVVMAEIDLTQVEKVRASLPSLRHDREFAGP